MEAGDQANVDCARDGSSVLMEGHLLVISDRESKKRK